MRRTAILASGLLALAFASRGVAGDFVSSDRSIYGLGQTWTDQDGKPSPLASLAGRPVIVTMGYTTCRDICPATVADMMWVDRHLDDDARRRVRFAFFSLDPEADTPERLRLYADSHGLDLSRWILLRPEDDGMARTLAAALDVAYRSDDKGGFDHSVAITLLNAQGEIIFQQRGAKGSAEDLLANLRKSLRPGE